MENFHPKKVGRYVDALADPGFKALFCNKRHPFVPITFLNSILPEDRQIKTIEFLDREIPGITAYNKCSRLDFHCIDQYNREFIVEMQVTDYEYFYLRALYYASRVFNSNLLPRESPNYGELRPVYIISLICGRLREPEFQGNENVLNWFRMYDIEHKVVAPNGINIIFVSLKDVPNSYEDCKDLFEQYCLLIKTIGEETKNPSEIAGGQFENILKAAEVESLPPEERIEYEKKVMNYYDYVLGLEQKFKDGKAEGAAEQNKSVAKALLENGVSIEIVSKSTGLSEAQLAAL